MNHEHPHADLPHGLDTDLRALWRQQATRRRAMRWLLAAGGAPMLGLAGCGGGDAADSTSSSTGATTTTTTTTTTSGSGTTTSPQTCSVIPEETNGPYPADGSNTVGGSVVNALTLSGIVRSDIRSSFGGFSGTASGVPLTVRLELVNANNGCATLDGYAVYLWHCSAGGLYSIYSAGATDQNWLRGVQATDSKGVATFTTIFPGCYAGRMPHIHFEVYRSLTTATSFSNRLKTSQLAFPTDVCDVVYALASYDPSKSNFARISFASDNVFSDGYATQLASVTGDAAGGYTATLRVAVAV